MLINAIPGFAFSILASLTLVPSGKIPNTPSFLRTFNEFFYCR